MEDKGIQMKLKAWDIGTALTPCYVTVMNAKDVFNISKVSRVEDGNEDGYQRFLSDKRVKDISKYLESGNIIPGAIILSAQEDFDISFDKENQELTLNANGSFLFVIDGQHRLAGANNANVDIDLPVCIFANLKLAQEVQYFLDVNSNQKGVPKTLRIELLKFLSEPESKDAILKKLFTDLGSDISSPLYNRLSATQSVRGKLTHVPFREAFDPLIEGIMLSKFSYEDKKNLVLNYLNAVESILNQIEGNSSKLTTSAFFQAIFKIFEMVCGNSITYFGNYKQASFETVLSGLSTIDFTRFEGSNQQNINALATEMDTLINMNNFKLTTPSDLF